ncbi:chorismate-binding protein [Chromobacterium phragmitis]|uniref:chorismate-binding protein n=1 Tax=Chromobacterium amazonense TaxID=1382803 RepID=UPI0021B73B75|nr:chorismate-binding protein [Chromobacterium amazonense]MBM2885541.1 chorismate-binding protein [Chromobacterium amazonense]
MSKIRLHSVPAPADGRQAPLFALQCNYDYTAKYAHHARAVERAALSALFFADRIALLPRSRNGVRIAEALTPLLGLMPDPSAPGAFRLPLDPDAPLAERLQQLLDLPARFDADPHFGLYGFFCYELIHAKLGLGSGVLGVFHLPERLIVDGVAVDYLLDPADAGGEAWPLALGPLLNADDFAAGRGQPYPRMYDIASQHIADGALRSLNPSFAIQRPCSRDGYRIHRDLLQRNPAPYNLYFDGGDFQLAGSSPAMFLRLRDGRLSTSPICGTVARGRDEAEDRLQVEKLLASDKDRFELEECVRADILAKEASCEDIRVDVAREVERFANVFHASASVSARLKPGKTLADAICDHLWPATVVGTPVDAAARLLAEHETRRWYAGAFGYLCADEAELGTVIRSALLAHGMATTRVGSTLSARSSPELERGELEAKASLILGVL